MRTFQQAIDQLLKDKKYSTARKKITVYLKKYPKDPEYIRLMGIVQLHENKLALAERNFVKVLSLDSNHAQAMANLAYIKQRKGEYDLARQWLEKSIQIHPISVETHHQLGIVANIQCDYESAETHYKEVLKINPSHIPSLVNLSILLKNRGEIDLSIHYLHQVLAINPMQPQIYWILANLKSYHFHPSEKEMVQLLLNQNQNPKDLEALLFTSAKILEDDGQYSESFTVLKKVNKLKYSGLNYKATDWQTLLNNIKTIFTADYVAANQNIQAQNTTPILIAGMPRSGSTLIEQILASHSKITGASELTYLTEIKNNIQGGYPQGLTKYSSESYQQIANSYNELTKKWSEQNTIYTDKMPSNINHAGILLMANSEAKLIHSRRNAMDVCLSAYKQNFENGNEFSYDLKELVQYYQFQEQLALHWRILFPGRVITVDYEKVISDTEAQVRTLLEFLGLEFQKSCLDFHQTKRNIRTASAGQITQKIYTSANLYYKNYGNALNELEALLNESMKVIPNES